MRRLACLVLAIGIVGALVPPSGSAPKPWQSCDRASVADLVRTFVGAYNRGDSQQLDQLWAREPDFEWYSVSPDERERHDAYDHDTLLPYFNRRHEVNDHLRMTSLRVRPQSDQGHFDITYRLHRRSDQPTGRGRYHGKAAAKEVMTLPSLDDLTMSRCVLFVWSMGKE